MDLITVAESRLSASRCVHSHFIIVSTFCQVTQLQHFFVDNFSLQTGYVKHLHANKEMFTVHYGGREKHEDSFFDISSKVKASSYLGKSRMQGPQGNFGLWSTSIITSVLRNTCTGMLQSLFEQVRRQIYFCPQ